MTNRTASAMHHRIFMLAFVLCMSASSSPVHAADAPPTKPMSADEFLQSLKPQSGTISLPGDIAALNLGDRFKYLSPQSTETLLVEGWNNPPGNETLGMVIPSDTNPVSEKGWGVVISYSKDGYVKDSDTDEINYDDLLKEMKEQTAEESKEMVSQGYPAVTLIGWAENPTYDKKTHKLYWAKEFSTEGATVHSLNYNIRVLGRQGVLVLNAVAGMDQIDLIKKEMPSLLQMTDFTTTNRYEDFNVKTDKVAEYGLTALVAGGVAAKMGLFAKLFAGLIALKKLVIVGVLAIGAFIKKLFTKKTPDAQS